MPDVSDVIVSLQRFSPADYILFVLMLLVCIVVGIYFGFVEKKDRSGGAIGAEDDYLVGGRKMPTIPVAMSLVAR